MKNVTQPILSIFRTVLFVTTLLLPWAAHAEMVTLTFEGLGDFEYAGDYYNGGTGGGGHGPGTNFGVSFPCCTNTYLNNGPSGAHFTGQATPFTALSFQQGNAWMNVSAGFTDSLSFFYGNPNQDSHISIYSQENGQGQRLATLFLPRTSNPDGIFLMQYVTVNFSGTARSVDFIEMANRGYVDDLSFNSTLVYAPVPEPETYAMLLAGFGLMCVIARRRGHKAAAIGQTGIAV